MLSGFSFSDFYILNFNKNRLQMSKLILFTVNTYLDKILVEEIEYKRKKA